MPPRLLLITFVMSACAGCPRLPPPPPVVIGTLGRLLSRKRAASLACVAGFTGGCLAAARVGFTPRGLPLPVAGGGSGCFGSITGGGGGGGSGGVSTTGAGAGGGATTAGARDVFLRFTTTRTTTMPMTASNARKMAALRLRGAGAATVPPSAIVLLSDISRGGAPGTCCGEPGRLSVCMMSEVAGRGGGCVACAPCAPAAPTPFVLGECGTPCAIGAGVSSNDDGSPPPCSTAPRAASAG